MSRFIRQQDLVPNEKLSEERILLIGAGAVGRNIGHALAAIGAKNVRVVDFDKVDTVNICTQGYTKEDVDKHKSQVLVQLMRSLDYEGDSDIDYDIDMWRPSKYAEYRPTTVFCAVDNMSTRKSIFRFCKKNNVNLLIDTRMLGNTLKLLKFTKDNIDEYEKTLFTDEQAEEGRCTGRSTMYAACALANLAVAQLALNLRGFNTKKIYDVDLLDELVE